MNPSDFCSRSRTGSMLNWVFHVTMQLDDFLQVNKDLSDVLRRKDAVSVQPLAENTVQDLQHAQMSALSVEQLCGVNKWNHVSQFGHFWFKARKPDDSPLMTSCRLISSGVRLSRTPRLTSFCQFRGSSSPSPSAAWSSSLWISAELTVDGTSILMLVKEINNQETFFKHYIW